IRNLIGVFIIQFGFTLHVSRITSHVCRSPAHSAPAVTGLTNLFDGLTHADSFTLQTSRAAVKINPRPLACLLSENGFHRALPFHFTGLAVAALLWPDQGSL